MKRLFILILCLLSISLVSSLSVDIPSADLSGSINSTCIVNVNDTVYWDGHEFVIGSIADIETDPNFTFWIDNGGVCTDADKCGYFSTCSQITDPIDVGCGAITDGNTNWDNIYGFWNSTENDFNETYTDTIYYSISNPLNFINETDADILYYSISNPLNFLNETTIENDTIVRNNTSPTFKNLTSTSIKSSVIYDLSNLLTIDLDNHLLYDLAEVLSIDFNDRKLYASDGTDIILDWYNPGFADFGDSQINTTSDVNIGGNLNPLITLTSDIGSGVYRWLTLYVQNISSENIDTYNLDASEKVTAGSFVGGEMNLTGNLNMSSNNITDIDCLEFINGGKICNG